MINRRYIHEVTNETSQFSRHHTGRSRKRAKREYSSTFVTNGFGISEGNENTEIKIFPLEASTKTIQLLTVNAQWKSIVEWSLQGHASPTIVNTGSESKHAMHLIQVA